MLEKIIVVIFMLTVWSFDKSNNVSQILLFLSLCLEILIALDQRFGSTKTIIFFTTKHTQKEHIILTFEIDGKKFTGMFDTGAEVSVIPLQH